MLRLTLRPGAASALHGIDQPLCKDCFRKTDKLLQSRISDLRAKSTV